MTAIEAARGESSHPRRACCEARGGRGLEKMEVIHGAQFELSVNGVPRSYRDRRDLALHSDANQSRNPNSVVKMKDLQTGKEIVIAFNSGEK
jgi:hypothetical protein